MTVGVAVGATVGAAVGVAVGAAVGVAVGAAEVGLGVICAARAPGGHAPQVTGQTGTTSSLVSPMQ